MNGENTRTPRVLIIDDMEENTALLDAFLRPRGFRTILAQNGEDGLERVRDSEPDIILLDLMMPGMDGFEVCKRLKSDPETHYIPVIIITGLADRDANIRAIEAGADDFLLKPFDSVLLEARIRASFKSKTLQDQVFEYQHQLEDYNHELEDAVKRRTEQVVQTQQAAVFGLAKLAESRDTETGDHLERVRCYARLLAQHILEKPKFSGEVTPTFPEQIYQSSPLHDIGKVGIPDRILLKPGKLTKEEFDIMKKHTVIGGETLEAADVEAGSESSFLAMGRDIAFTHHEKWDGSGYPYGLAGEKIPLASRIVAVADVYDALTSRRPYKEPFSHEKSMAIITGDAGKHFDPDIVDAFVEIEAEIIEVRERFNDTVQYSPIQELNMELERLHADQSAE